jgi:Flp pilus assembly protein protease CpaA
MNTTILFIIQAVIAAVTCLAAAIFDIKTNQIPNKLTFPVISIGLILTLITQPITTFIIAFVAIIIWFFLGMTNFMGLGDIKLVMAITAIGGCHMGIISFIIGILFLCLFALVTNPIETGVYVHKMLRRLRFKKEPIYKGSTKYKFAPFLFLGVIFYILFVDKYSPFMFDFKRFFWGV